MSDQQDRFGWLAFAMWMLGLIALAVVARELPGLGERIAAERGIDAHTVQVTATYAEFHEAEKYSGRRSVLGKDKWVLTYEYDGRPIRAVVLMPPAGDIGDELCVEIDAEQPDRARECGTSGVDLELSVIMLVLGGLLLIPPVAFFAVRARRRRRRESAAVDARRARGVVGPVIPDDYRGQDLVLRPTTVTRVAMTIIYPSAVGMLAVGMSSDPSVARGWLVAAIAATGLLAARCWRVAILCAEGTVTVRGVLLTRRIPADALIEVSDNDASRYPSIWWDAPSGRRRRTRVIGFWAADRALSRLRGWIKANRGISAERVWLT